MTAYTLEIHSTPEQAFTLSQDYDVRPDWDPFPESYEFLNGTVVEKGLRVLVNAKNGFSMVVEYISFESPKVAAVKMIDGPWFIKKFSGSWLFKEMPDGNCGATFKYSIQGGPGIVGIFITPLLKLIFQRNAMARLKALKSFVEKEIE